MQSQNNPSYFVKLFLLPFVFFTISITPPKLWAGDDAFSENLITVKRPPDSLAQWYKPANKRQVWLHTMFSLRRAMLAIKEYAADGDLQGLNKWVEKFSEDYVSISQMVPEWEDYTRLELIEKLRQLAVQGQFEQIPSALKPIGKTCRQCHDDHQATAALLYRGIDFNGIVVNTGQAEHTEHYDVAMENLSDAVNRINIAIIDNYFSKALQAIPPLESKLGHLKTTCSNCHKDDQYPVKRIFDASDNLLAELQQSLAKENGQQAGRDLGEFAVNVCAKCHSIHRIQSDLYQLIK